MGKRSIWKIVSNFVQQPMPPGSHTGAGRQGQSGALGRGQRTATALSLFESFCIYTMPLFGAYLSDTHLGRFATICLSILIALIGHLVLMVSTLPGIIERSNTSLGVFCLGLVIMATGAGLMKPNISVLIAEQNTDRVHIKTIEATGERVLVDPAATSSRVYLYFYLIINLGALAGSISMVYCEKYLGYLAAFSLPTGLFLLCPLIMLIMRTRYKKTSPSSSALSRAIRTFVMCLKPQVSWNIVRSYRNLHKEGFWDAATPTVLEQNGIQKPAWMDFEDEYINELRRAMKACHGNEDQTSNVMRTETDSVLVVSPILVGLQPRHKQLDITIRNCEPNMQNVLKPRLSLSRWNYMVCLTIVSMAKNLRQ